MRKRTYKTVCETVRKTGTAGAVRLALCISCLASLLYLAAGVHRYQTARNEYRRLAEVFGSRLDSGAPDWNSGRQISGRRNSGRRNRGRQNDESDGSRINGDQNNGDLSGKDDSDDFLRSRNPDYVFWLTIPGTHVNYPVVKSVEEGYYLNHTFEGEENPGGCLFVSADGEPLAEDNTVVYGHNMKDGSMFADLKKYIRKEYYEAHPDVWVYGNGGWSRYEIFSCEIRHEDDDTAYRSHFAGCDEKKEYLESVCGTALYETDARPRCGDRLLTLSTCYGSEKRVIVRAVLLCYTE